MDRKSIQYSVFDKKIIWVAVGIFAISGILPWFVVNFPIGNLKISIADLMVYFMDSNRVEIDFYSFIIYGVLLVGWIFTMFFLIATAVLQKKKLILVGSLMTILPALIWAFSASSLRIQMIFLSLSNQPINANQTTGSGEMAALLSGFVLVYLFFKGKKSS